MYVTITRKIISSYDVVFDEIFSIMLSYKSQPHAEAMDMHPSVSHTPYDTYSREQTGNITTFENSEEGNLWSETQSLLPETFDNTESGNKTYDNSTMQPLISEEEIDAIYSGDESEYEPISTEMLEDIRDGSESHLRVNRR